VVRELDVERRSRHVIANAKVYARTKAEPISERRRLGVRTEIELFGVNRDPCVRADRLADGNGWQDT
jgi:hypothetical protein